MSGTQDITRKLTEIFAPVGAGPAGTGTVLTSPSSIDADIAKMVAKELDLDQVLNDIGVVAARQLADELEKRTLRPADYADIDELAATLARRLARNLEGSEVFARALKKHLNLRG